MMSLRVLRRSANDFNGGTRTQHPHMVLNLFRFFSRGPHRPHAISTRNHLFCSRWDVWRLQTTTEPQDGKSHLEERGLTHPFSSGSVTIRTQIWIPKSGPDVHIWFSPRRARSSPFQRLRSTSHFTSSMRCILWYQPLWHARSSGP